MPSTIRLALTHQGPPEIGTMSTFVKVLFDLSVVLPATLAGAWALWHRRPTSHVVGPVLSTLIPQAALLGVFQPLAT